MNSRFITKPIVAFYWYDLDTSPIWYYYYLYYFYNGGEDGKLYYHVYDSDDTGMLTKINEIVALKSGTATFKAAWALVATWDHVRPWPNWWYSREVRFPFFALISRRIH